MENLTLEQQLKQLKKTVKGMNPKHYRLQSEYHRLMYSYTQEIEMIDKVLNLQNPDRDFKIPKRFHGKSTKLQ